MVMSKQKQVLTKEGLAKLEDKLTKLMEERKKTAVQIREAREFGDLAENAEYAAARDRQALVESQIAEVEARIKDSEVVEGTNHDNSHVTIGHTVTIEVRGQKKDFTIVGKDESAPARGKVSNESPIGQALMGSKIGDEVVVETPSGNTRYKIRKIS